MKRRLECLVIINELNKDDRFYYDVDESDLKEICERNALNFEITNRTLEEAMKSDTYEIHLLLPLFVGYEPAEGVPRVPHMSDRPTKYRKKPVVIEARQLVGTNAEFHAVYQWIEANTQGSFDPLSEEIPASGVSIDPATGFFLIATLEGVMQAKPGDWIIRGVQGEFYPCKPDIFAATYEPA